MERRHEPQASDAAREMGGVKMEKLLLASASPRRAEILRAVGWPFETLATDIDETLNPGESAVLAVERLALEKARAAAERSAASLVLGADTAVVVDELILGKPLDEEDARRMLCLLSGRWHDVLTGVAMLRSGGGERASAMVAHEKTRVRFAHLSDDEINWYVRSGEPMDKAGAYAVQNRAALFIEEIQGDYWNVVGLPVRLVYRLAARV